VQLKWNEHFAQRTKEVVMVQSGRILLVDDDEQITALLPEFLELDGHNVTASTRGVTALDIFQRGPYDFDLVITDYVMPEMTGDVLIRALWQVRPDIPVIFCSGSSQLVDELQRQGLHPHAVLAKPVTQEELCQTVQDVLNQYARPDTPSVLVDKRAL
jgi:CheY-like chemotaxis protein